MTKFMRWGGDLPASFGSVFKAEGWHITVSRLRDKTQVLEYKGGAESAALAAVEGLPTGRRTNGAGLEHTWQECACAEGQIRDALVFSGICGDDMEMTGAILLSRDEFRGSNSRTEADLLEFIGYLVELAANSIKINTQAQLMREVGEVFSIQLVIFDKFGEIVFESAKGMNFLCEALGLKCKDFQKVQWKLEKLVSHIETADSADRSAVFDLEPGQHPVADPEKAPRYKLIKLHVDDNETHLPGPYFAIIETRQPEMPDPNTLGRQFALTPAEARVVTRLIEGAPIPDISVDLRLSTHTVRTYLKRSYGKVGVSGQAQLISKITRLSDSIGTMPKAVGA